MTIDKLFSEAAKKNASDVHLAVGQPPIFRINGTLQFVGKTDLTQREVTTLVKSILDDRRWKIFEDEREMDFAYEIKTQRFRVNVHYDRGNVALAARVIPSKIPSMDDIGLPEVVKDLIGIENGLVLVTGPAGSGKSTSLAAMINHLNQTKANHIITLEDPIEYVFPKGKGLVKQREVGADTLTFAQGLRRSLRQDPDIIMVGEMRDAETISTTLTLAETGHLVFSTLHTNDAAQAIYRIVDSFEGAQQDQIRRQLSLSLRGVIAQVLLKRKGGGLVAAREILINTGAVANLIRENRVEQITSVIQTGRAHGMKTMGHSIRELIDEGIVEEDDAQEQMPESSKSRHKKRGR